VSPAVDRAAHEIAQAAIEMGERVAELDRTGACVTYDLYTLALDASRRHLVNPVRALTAADDLIRGLRDFLRGPKTLPRSRYGMYGPNCRLEEYDKGWWNA